MVRDGMKEASLTDRISLTIPEILTVKEVAAILKVPVSWIYDHTRSTSLDPIPCFKVGKYLRFLPGDIREYVQRLHAKHGDWS